VPNCKAGLGQPNVTQAIRTERLRHTEVGDERLIHREKYVLWFKVAMDDTLSVCVVESQRDFSGKLEGGLHR
jgi:hypothetical protein